MPHMSKRKGQRPISCSELGTVTKCAQAYAFHCNNTKQTSNAHHRMRAGTKHHENFNEQIKRQERTDKRCFIATHIYGENAIQTQKLRAFRDNTLLRYNVGQKFVRQYYRYSPAVIEICKGSKILDFCLTSTMRLIVRVLLLSDVLLGRLKRSRK